jgi:GNAT superfamily N-acetyltransferase
MDECKQRVRLRILMKVLDLDFRYFGAGCCLRERWDHRGKCYQLSMEEMNVNKQYAIIEYHPKYASKTVKMWRDSKEQAIDQKEIHPFENHVYFINHILPERFQINLAVINEKVVGLIAYNKTEINQLYIHVDHQGIGIGEALLNIAKKHSSGSLTLYTFEKNKNAQRFYEKHGFIIIGRGTENEENLPDILYEWTFKK